MSFIGAVRSSARFLLSLALLAAGCSTSTPDCPVYDVGAIEGRILGGGLPVSARIRLRPFDSGSHTDLEVMSDSSGGYAIPAPSGPYYI